MATLMAILLGVLPGGPPREEVDRKLETRMSVEFHDMPLSDAIERFRSATGLNFMVEAGADTKVRLTVREVTARSALRLLLQPIGLSAVHENGTVVVRRRQDEAVTLRVYDVRGLMTKLQDFPGVDLDLGAGPYFCILCIIFPENESPVCPLADRLVSLVQGNTGRGSWQENPRASISLVNGLLMVRQTHQVHRQVEELLKQLGL